MPTVLTAPSAGPPTGSSQADAASTRRVALIVAASLFMVLLDGAILNTSVPQMAAGLGVAPLDLSASITLYLLASVAIMPTSGWVADRFGARRVFVASIAVFTLSSVACGLVDSLPPLLAARVAQGLAGGLLVPVGRMLVIRRASKAELMDATALITWPALMAPVLGPPLGGFITSYLSWRWNFFLNLPLGLFGVWLTLRWVPAAPLAAAERLDWRGALLSASGLVMLLLGLELFAHLDQQAGGWAGPAALVAVALVAAGAGALAWAVHHLRRTDKPLVSLAPLGVKTFAIASVHAGTFFVMTLQAMPFLLPLMFQLGFGMTPVHAGLLTLAYFAGNLAMKSVTTRILRRFGFRTVLLVNGVLAALAMAACALLQADTPVVLLAAVLACAGATRSMQMTAVNTLAFADIAPAQRSAAATLSSVGMQVAAVLGVAVGAVLLAAAHTWHGRATLAAVDFRIAILGMALIALLCTLGFTRLTASDGAEVSGHRLAR